MSAPAAGQLEAWLHPGDGSGDARAYLRRVQAQLHWVPREALLLACEQYQVSLASLYEEVSLSPYFSLEPRGERVIEVCQGLSCREVGGAEILKEFERLAGLKAGQTGPDAKLSLLGVGCFGRCAIGANVRSDGQFCHNFTPAQAAAVLQALGKSA